MRQIDNLDKQVEEYYLKLEQDSAFAYFLGYDDEQDLFKDFAKTKVQMRGLANSLHVPLEEESFGPITGYKEYYGLFCRSWKKNEFSGALTYGFCLATGILPPYADFRLTEQKDLAKIFVSPSGFAISPLAALGIFFPTLAVLYGAEVVFYHALIHGYYNGTEHGALRLWGHEFTHIYQMLLAQKMKNDGLLKDLEGFLDTSFNELEDISWNRFAVREHLKEDTKKVIKLIITYQTDTSNREQ